MHAEDFLSDELRLRVGKANLSRIDWPRLSKEAKQNMVHHQIILLLKTRVRDSRHHGEVLIWIGKIFEKLNEIIEARNAVPLASHD